MSGLELVHREPEDTNELLHVLPLDRTGLTKRWNDSPFPPELGQGRLGTAGHCQGFQRLLWCPEGPVEAVRAWHLEVRAWLRWFPEDGA